MTRSSTQKSASLIAVLFVVVGTATTGFLSWWQFSAAQRRDDDHFARRTEELRRELLSRLDVYRYGLRGTEALFKASDRVTRADLSKAVGSWDLFNDFPGAIGMGYIERVPNNAADMARFVQETRADNYPDFGVHLPPDAAPLARSLTDDRMIVKYVLPLESNAESLGLDIGAHPVRRLAAEQAMRSGKLTITGRIQLVQDAEIRPGFLIIAPVFATDAPTRTVEQRLECLQGWVYMPLIADKVFRGVSSSANDEIDFHLHDGEPSIHNLIYDADEHLDGSTGSKASTQEMFANRTHVRQVPIAFGGRIWTAVMSESDDFVYASRDLAWAIAVAGATVTLLTGYLIYSQGRQVQHAEHLAEQMTEEVRRLATVCPADHQRRDHHRCRPEDRVGQCRVHQDYRILAR